MNNHAKALHAEKFNQLKEAHAKKLAAKSNNTLRPQSWRGELSNAGVPIKEQKAAARQATIRESVENSRQTTWPMSSSKHKAVERKILKMMVTDFRPFSIVDSPGFFELCAHLESRFEMPCRSTFRRRIGPLYREFRQNVQTDLDKAKYVATTSDIWTDSTSNYTFISLSGHYLDEHWQLRDYVLHGSFFPDAHTAVNISDKLTEMYEEWKVQKERQSVIVRDGASNMVLGTELAKLQNLHCTIHLLQLAVNDAIFIQPSVSNITRKCRAICAHMNRSAKATQLFKDLQDDVDESQKLRLRRDVPTRWNSVMLMLERFHRLKTYVQRFCLETDLTDLTLKEWERVPMILRILRPFYELTVRLSSDLCAASYVIPEALQLQLDLENMKPELRGVNELHREMMKAIQHRFFATTDNFIDQDADDNDKTKKCSNVLRNPTLAVATLIDPRFKFCFPAEDVEEAKKHLLAAALEITVLDPLVELGLPAPVSAAPPAPPVAAPEPIPSTSSQTSDVARASATSIVKKADSSFSNSTDNTIMTSTPICGSTSNKRSFSEAFFAAPTLNTAKKPRFGKLLAQSVPVAPLSPPVDSRVISAERKKEEIALYMAEPRIAEDADHLQYWRLKESNYPTLAALARKYLCVPASSVYSERLFSEYNGLYEKKRSRITPDCAEQVLFLHHNWERVESNGRKVNADSGQKGDDFHDVEEDMAEQARIDVEANAVAEAEMDMDI